MAKAERKSTVHRRVPLDLVVVPLRENGKVTGIGVHAGLWTSEGLRVPPEEVPVLRRRLERLDEDFGFDPKGHSGKALRHAVASLPRDLLITIDYEAMRDLVMMAMSLADRPRPALLQVRSILKGQLFTFVWLPREELTTARRTAIANLLNTKVGRDITSWSVELGDGDLALIRYTQYIDEDAPLPDAEALDAAVVEMVRGWSPAVEAELIAAAGAARATRLALTYINAFPEGYRAPHRPGRGRRGHPAAVRACRRRRSRGAHLARRNRTARGSCASRPTGRGGLIPLSEAVPVLENFGFRVLEEFPTALFGGNGYIHDFRVEVAPEADLDAILARTAEIEHSIANVLCGVAEDDEFNQLVLYAALDTQAVVLDPRLVPLPAPNRKQLRAHHHRRCAAPGAQCDPRLDRPVRCRARPGGERPAGAGREEPRAARRSLAKIRSIDDDRILRRLRALVEAIVRTNAFAPAAEEALAFKIDSSWFPACRGRCRGAKSGSTARASKASTCAADRWPAAASAGRTGATTSVPRSSA